MSGMILQGTKVFAPTPTGRRSGKVVSVQKLNQEEIFSVRLDDDLSGEPLHLYKKHELIVRLNRF